jgi:putative membrane protein
LSRGYKVLPPGFLGTRADILMDIVILSFLLILPLLAVSWQRARSGCYAQHRAMQLTLASFLAVAVLFFELDLKLSGGIFELTRESAYAGTGLLNTLIYGHTLVAIGSALIWVPLVFISMKKFGKPPAPNAFSGRHRFWGRLGMVLMILSGCSAMPLYYVGFAL